MPPSALQRAPRPNSPKRCSSAASCTAAAPAVWAQLGWRRVPRGRFNLMQQAAAGERCIFGEATDHARGHQSRRQRCGRHLRKLRLRGQFAQQRFNLGGATIGNFHRSASGSAAVAPHGACMFLQGNRDIIPRCNMARYSSKSWRAFRPGATVNEPLAPTRRVAAPAVVVNLSAGRCRILGLDPGSRRTGFGVIDCVWAANCAMSPTAASTWPAPIWRSACGGFMRRSPRWCAISRLTKPPWSACSSTAISTAR